MKIKKIEIENYRGILNEKIEFNDKVNVFIGGNGAGKTTLLEAILASLIKITFPFISSHTYKPYLISVDDINYNKTYSTILSKISLSKLDTKKGTLDEQIELPFFVKAGVINETTEEKEWNIKYNTFSNLLNKTVLHGFFKLPIIKYYPANRGSVKYVNTSSSTIYKNPRIETWANIIQNDVSYSKFFKWFLEHETQELRMQRDARKFEVKSKYIDGVRKSISKAFKILNNRSYLVKSDEIKKNGNNSLIPVLVLEEIRTKRKEILDNKSEGEKAITSLIADIAYNLSIAHNFKENDDFSKSTGVVIIDEIEAHLHPKWQRKIIPLLTELFPNIQFFITTHSPQVIASVNSENMFVCDNFKFEKINIKTRGMDSNTLLKYVFNATERPKEYIDLIEKFREMMDDEKSPEELQIVIDEIAKLESVDHGIDQSQLVDELNLELAAYKFDLAHEVD